MKQVRAENQDTNQDRKASQPRLRKVREAAAEETNKAEAEAGAYLDEEEISNLIHDEEPRKKVLHTIVSFRFAVAWIFVNNFKAERKRELWSGKGGIIPLIRKKLELNPSTKLDHILEAVLEYMDRGEQYKEESECASNRGRRAIISDRP